MNVPSNFGGEANLLVINTTSDEAESDLSLGFNAAFDCGH